MNRLPISKIMFKKYDVDESGSITIDEFKNMSYDLGYFLTDTEFDLAMKRIAKPGSNSITYDECRIIN